MGHALKTPSFDLLQGLVLLFAYEGRIGDAIRAREILALVLQNYERLDFTEAEVVKEQRESAIPPVQVAQAKAKAAWGLYMFDW